jgi:hypothetical protein
LQGDFSRDTFDRFRHFSRVLRQQGRVALDADTNEQTSILLHLIRTLARDVFWPDGCIGDAFQIATTLSGTQLTDLTIARGHYYVGGILCENEPPLLCPSADPAPVPYSDQPSYKTGSDPLKGKDGPFLVYLDVWEQHVNWIEDNSIREVALGGPDTSTRAHVVWQVRTYIPEADEGFDSIHKRADIKPNGPWDTFVAKSLRPPDRGCLSADLAPVPAEPEPCSVAPRARYRGTENQLYRVEIHGNGKTGDPDNAPTFKWSRDNGSLVYPIRKLDLSSETAIVILDSLGRDARSSLEVGEWVEVVDLAQEPPELFRVSYVSAEDLTVRLHVPAGATLAAIPDDSTKAYLRRWDHRNGDPKTGAIAMKADTPFDLENGIQVTFGKGAGSYRRGDYWLIPARTATGDIEWPRTKESPPQAILQPPRGVDHFYAPLAIVRPGPTWALDDLRNSR